MAKEIDAISASMAETFASRLRGLRIRTCLTRARLGALPVPRLPEPAAGPAPTTALPRLAGANRGNAGRVGLS